MQNNSATPIPSSVNGAVALLGRLLFVLIFLRAAPKHFMSETIAYAASKGVLFAAILVPVSGVIALSAGLSILLGYRAKFGAWLMAFFLACVTPAMHNF
jgi:putative oxidoreductase